MKLCYKADMFRRTLFVFICLLTTSVAAFGNQRLISIGDRRLSIDCDGDAVSSTKVLLMAGGGRTAKDWGKVQPQVSSFARVCSYDRAGLGESDKAPTEAQSVDEIIDDLHRLLIASDEKGPFILVAHSIAGIYARSFATRFPRYVAGFVFVDSSDEEQALRLHQIDPKQKIDEATALAGFFTIPGERLKWTTRLPLIVLARGKPSPRPPLWTDEQLAAWDKSWRGFQEDLAKRSPHGELRVATESGHFIQLAQPELVIQAIRDVSHAQ